MPLYEMTPDAFRPLGQASFTDLKVRERDDLQRLLRTQIDVLSDDLYVLTEEFGDWDDSRRRIDLLAIDPQANAPTTVGTWNSKPSAMPAWFRR
jgi:hypothetical protein